MSAPSAAVPQAKEVGYGYEIWYNLNNLKKEFTQSWSI